MALAVLSPFPAATATVTRAAAITCIKASIAGGASLGDDRAAALGEAASAQVERFAPDAPQASKNEAVIRLAGWLHGRRPQPLRTVTTGSLTMDFGMPATSAFRSSGARSLLTPWRVRRALPVEDAS